jgi:NTE family protein
MSATGEPRIRLVHRAYQAVGHELSAKTFDYSPSSIRDRWAAGQSDMAHGLALLDEAAGDERRFKHLAVDLETAAAAAEVGAKRVAGVRF